MLILLALVAGLLQYGQVKGFKNTLQELVETKSNGRLVLDLGETTIDYLDLSFHLDQVQLYPSEESDGLQKLVVPSIRVNIGSLFSYAFSRQLEIEELIIEEPYATVKLPENKGRGPNRVNVAHQLALFAPGIEAFLEKIRIDMFRIEKGGSLLDPADQGTIKISLVDLAILNWDMRDLSDEADIELDIGAQALQFSQSEFSFEAISYAYSANELRIHAYNFNLSDSLGRMVLNLSGEEIAIREPDFDALLNREEYVFGHLQIDEPKVLATIYPSQNSNSGNSGSRHPVSDILKKNLGNLTLNTGLLTNAELILNLIKPGDTVRLVLPGISMHAESLMVREDSSTLMIEALNIQIDSSRIDLGDDLEVNFSSLEYDQSYNVFLTDIDVLSRARNASILKGERLSLYRLNVFTYLYENRVQIDSVHLRNGSVYIGEAPRKTFSGLRKEERPEASQPSVFIDRILLDNVHARYAMNGIEAEVHDVNALVEDVSREPSLLYSLRYIEIPRATVRREELTASIRQVRYEPKNIKLQSIRLETPEASMQISDVRARPEKFLLETPDAHEWTALNVSEIVLEGDVSRFMNQPDKEKTDSQNLFFQDISVDQLRVDIRNGDSLSVRLAGNRIRANGLSEGPDGIRTGSLSGNFENFEVLKGPDHFLVDQLMVNTGEKSLATGFRGMLGRDTILAERIEIQRISMLDSSFATEGIDIRQLTFKNTSIQALTDKVLLGEVRIGGGRQPHAGVTEIFGPRVMITTQPDTPKRKGGGFPDIVDKVILHAGELRINTDKVDFGEITMDISQSEHVVIGARNIDYATDKMVLAISEISGDGEGTVVRGLSVVPPDGYEKSLETEEDVIVADFQEIRLNGLTLERLQEEERIRLPEIQLNGWTVSIARDKRLPDKDPENKPHLLSEFLPLPESIEIGVLKGTDGSLRYSETGERTGQTGRIHLNDMQFSFWPEGSNMEHPQMLQGTFSIYGEGKTSFAYGELDESRFWLQLSLRDMPIAAFNPMIDSLEAVKVTSGFLKEFEFYVTGDSVSATGDALITYDDLHLEIFKRGEPDVRNLGSELLTLLADGIILRHSREDAISPVSQERIPHKSPINYWIKSLIQGAMKTVRKGKKPR